MTAARDQGDRARAWARWQQLGWPPRRSEAWRNFSTRPLQSFELAGGIVSGTAPDAALVASLPRPRAVLLDGRYAPELSDLDGLGAVVVAPIDVAAIDALTPEDGALEALNTALLGDGVHVRVPAGVAGGVLHVVHLVGGQGTAHVRTVVTLEAGASLTLGALHIGWGEAAYFVNAVTELTLAEGASLSLGKCVREGAGGSHLEAVHARVAASAHLSTYTLSLTGARVRTGINVTLAGEGAAADVDGLYLGKGREVLDHVTDIRHAVGATRSSQSWSGVLDDRSEGGFQGVIRIDSGAAKSATRQLTRTLLLSDDAEAHARPELHIDCDEVEASHGATVGQLDATEQFYLESRGIPPDEARRILIRAFVDTQLARAPEGLRRPFGAAITELLGPGAMAGETQETPEDDDGV